MYNIKSEELVLQLLGHKEIVNKKTDDGQDPCPKISQLVLGQGYQVNSRFSVTTILSHLKKLEAQTRTAPTDSCVIPVAAGESALPPSCWDTYRRTHYNCQCMFHHCDMDYLHIHL
jgi:hypothetical protein